MSRRVRKNVFSIADFFMKTRVVNWLGEIESMDSWSSDRIENWQNSRLTKLILHAYNNTVYYKKTIDELGLKPQDFKSISDLSKFPVLTREIINSNFKDLVAYNQNDIPHKKKHTGGTTNEPMSYLLDNNSWSFINANYIFNWEKSGYLFGKKYIALGSSSIRIGNKIPIKNRIYYHLKNRISLNGMSMTEKIYFQYLDIIRKSNIEFIYGYASSIYMLAKYTLNNNIEINLKACFSTSEILTELYRETIIKAFRCEIINCYGANDGGITAFDHGDGYFKVGYNSIITKSAADLNQDKAKPMLTTNILNYSMPLINYEIGDLVTMSNNYHSYNGQCFNRVLGRKSDVIHLENGVTFTSTGFYGKLFKNLPVIGYKFVKGAVNELKCEIKIKPDFDISHETIIREFLQNYGGSDTLITVIYVDKFIDSASGKKAHIIVE